MEILSKLWVAMTTENETIINILLILFLFIEIPITMQIFLTIFNVRSTVKQKLSYLALTVPIGAFCVFFIPKPYSNIITMVTAPFIIMGVFKMNFFKALLSEFFSIAIITVLEIAPCKNLFLHFPYRL